MSINGHQPGCVAFLRDMMLLSLRKVHRGSATADWHLDLFEIPINTRRFSLQNDWYSMLELMPYWTEELRDHAKTFVRPLRRLSGCCAFEPFVKLGLSVAETNSPLEQEESSVCGGIASQD
jgi:hypothetical protein